MILVLWHQFWYPWTYMGYGSEGRKPWKFREGVEQRWQMWCFSETFSWLIGSVRDNFGVLGDSWGSEEIGILASFDALCALWRWGWFVCFLSSILMMTGIVLGEISWGIWSSVGELVSVIKTPRWVRGRGCLCFMSPWYQDLCELWDWLSQVWGGTLCGTLTRVVSIGMLWQSFCGT